MQPLKDKPSKDRPPTPVSIYVGLACCAVSLVWWFAYYAQYGGAFGLMNLKLACIGFPTQECLFFQANIRGALPRYVPAFWYAGMAALAVGVWQIWQQRAK